MADELLTVAQTCQLLGVSERTLRRVLKEPVIQAKLQAINKQVGGRNRQIAMIGPELLSVLNTRFSDGIRQKNLSGKAGGNQQATQEADTSITPVRLALIFEQRLLDKDALIKEQQARITDLQSTLEYERDQNKRLQLLLVSTTPEERAGENQVSSSWSQLVKALNPTNGLSGWLLWFITTPFSVLLAYLANHYILPSVKFLRTVPPSITYLFLFAASQLILMWLYFKHLKSGDDEGAKNVYIWVQLSFVLVMLLMLISGRDELADSGDFITLGLLTCLAPIEVIYFVVKIGERIRNKRWGKETINGCSGCLVLIYGVVFESIYLWWMSH